MCNPLFLLPLNFYVIAPSFFGFVYDRKITIGIAIPVMILFYEKSFQFQHFNEKQFNDKLNALRLKQSYEKWPENFFPQFRLNEKPWQQ